MRQKYNDWKITGKKTCTKCKRELLVSEFHLQRGRPRTRCKVCRIKEVKEWKKNNPEKVKLWQQGNREKNREKIRERQKIWRSKNPEKLKEYYEKRKDKISMYGKQFDYSSDKGRYLNGDGMCLYCGEIFPLILEEHHIFGRTSDSIITLCAKHHAYFTRGYWKLLMW